MRRFTVLCLCFMLVMGSTMVSAQTSPQTYQGESFTFNYPDGWQLGVDTPNHVVLLGDGLQVDIFASSLTTERVELETVIRGLASSITEEEVTLTETTINERPALSVSLVANDLNWLLLALETSDDSVFLVRAFSASDDFSGVSAIVTSIAPTQTALRGYASPNGGVQFIQPLGYDVRAITANTFIVSNTPNPLPDAASTEVLVPDGEVTFILFADVVELPAYVPQEGDTALEALQSYLSLETCQACNGTFSDYAPVTVGQRTGYQVSVQFPAFSAKAYALDTPEGVIVIGVYASPTTLEAESAMLDVIAESMERVVYTPPTSAETRQEIGDNTLFYPEGWAVDGIGEAIRLRTNVSVLGDPARLKNGQVLVYIFPSLAVLEAGTGYQPTSESLLSSTIALYFTSQAGIVGATGISDIQTGTVNEREFSRVTWLAPEDTHDQQLIIISDGNGDFYTLFAFAPANSMVSLEPILLEIIAKFGQSQ